MNTNAARTLLTAAVFFTAAASWASPMQKLKKGNRLFWKGDYEQALKMYKDALIDMPDNAVLHFNSGDASYQLGDFASAETEFDEAAKSAMVPLKSAARYNKGNVFFRQGKWNDAVEAYKDALRTNPSDEDAKFNLGLAMRAKQNPPKQQKQQQKKGQGGMSREDAERLLSAAKSGEMKNPSKKAPAAQKSGVDEDW